MLNSSFEDEFRMLNSLSLTSTIPSLRVFGTRENLLHEEWLTLNIGKEVAKVDTNVLFYVSQDLLFYGNLQTNRIQSEFSSYKARAHALLQRKDAELAAARDSEQLKALEEALKVHASWCN